MYNSNLLIQSMIDHIYETNDEFPFSKINISKPVALTGGTHLIKFSLNSMPLYVNPPKCNMKVNLVRTVEDGEHAKKVKRTHCDFIFSQEHDSFLRWIENLEEFSQKKIFENRSQWFESTLEQEDIENSFTSPLKVIKSGKQYLLRVSIPQTKSGDRNGFKIFNENEQELAFEDIDESRQILCVLEIRGIRFSSKSFQIEIDVKQMMALNPVDLFDRCVLLKRPVNTSVPVSVPVSVPNQDEIKHEESHIQEPIVQNEVETPIEQTAEETQEEYTEVKQNEENLQDQQPQQEQEQQQETTKGIDGLDEVELDLDNMSTEDTITLKQRNDVYYEMYMEARRKAKIARDLALSAYLEARRIKNTYMLNDIIDSDNDDDESDMEELEELKEMEEK